MVDAPGVLCAPCWEQIVFLGPPECDSCGLPFEYDVGEGALCGACTRKRPAYRRARAAMVYDDASGTKSIVSLDLHRFLCFHDVEIMCGFRSREPFQWPNEPAVIPRS